MVAIARKLKNIWVVWNTMVGFETIICEGENGQYQHAIH